MGIGEFPAPHTISIPMRYAILLRDLRLSFPVCDDSFNPDDFSTIFGALKCLQVRMGKFEHNLDTIELGMSKLEHRIDNMELLMEQLQRELNYGEGEVDPPNSCSRMHETQQQHQQQYTPPSPHPSLTPPSNSTSAAHVLALEPP
uniref:Uncharacterized protein n=1 Tax=Physcomitrium patens TaxID=3218 RepID=A9SVM7_PHYPA|nr:hypothetical protein PHYPA_003044 [Physcomitrium patens]